MKKIGVGVIGFGTIGAGVVQIIQENRVEISRRLGGEVDLVKVVDLDIETDRGVEVAPELLSTNINDILENPEVHIVVELIGGYEPAKKFILQAMANGKHVVTANKALLAVHGPEVFTASADKEVDLGFEAAVAGGIPILRAMREALAADRVTSFYGILNGTTNFILTEMKEKGESFDRVLGEAQKLGYAEADPTFDVEGVDAAHKLALLCTMAFGQKVEFESVHTEGIRGITVQDIEYARDFGFEIKLLAIGKYDGERVEARVHPTMIPSNHLLSDVSGVYNAVYVEADFLGPTLYYGQGAGRRATASAVMADVIEIARNIISGAHNRVAPLGFSIESLADAPVKPIEDIVCHYYLRFMAVDKPNVLSKIAGVLGSRSISIESVVQVGRDSGQAVPLVIMTHEAREADIRKALGEIEALGVVMDTPSFIRIES